jgi:hypothetical protein
MLPTPLGGTVEVASLGVTQLTPEHAPTITTIHVHMVVGNVDDAVPWTFETTSPTVVIPGEDPLHAVAVSSDLRTLPIVVIARGERHVLDYYFLVPARFTSENPLAMFEFSARIKVGTRSFESQTRFTRQRDPGMPAKAARTTPAYWWFDPMFPWPTYHRRPGVATPRPPHYATVTQTLAGSFDALTPAPRDDAPNDHECDQW